MTQGLSREPSNVIDSSTDVEREDTFFYIPRGREPFSEDIFSLSATTTPTEIAIAVTSPVSSSDEEETAKAVVRELSRHTAPLFGYAELQDQLNRTSSFLETTRDEEGAPNARSVELTIRVINELWDHSRLVPDLVNPTYEESIVLEFVDGDIYDALEIHNDGDIIYLKRRPGQPVEVEQATETQIREVITQISNARGRGYLM